MRAVTIVLFLVATNISTCLTTVVDLTHTYGWDVIYPPVGKGMFNFTNIHKGKEPSLRNHWLEVNWFSVFEHGGTHIDAPAHYTKGGAHIHEVPAGHLIGPGVMINITGKAKQNPDYLMTIEDITDWEVKNGKIPTGAIVMMNTGKHKLYPDKKLFYGTETPDDTTTYHNPGIHQQAAIWLRQNRHIRAFGTDAHSCDPGQNDRYNRCHEEFLPYDVVLLEFVANLDMMPKTGSTVFAGAIKMRDGSGGPCRIMALFGGEDTSSAGPFLSVSLSLYILSVILYVL